MKTKPYFLNSNALCFLDLASLRYKELSQKLKTSHNLNISCLEDKELNASFYKCEIASINYVLALLCKMLDPQAFNKLDEGYLSAESCFGEEEALEVLAFLKKAQCIVFDTNLKKHKDFKNIVFFMNFLSAYFNLDLVCADEKEQDLEIEDFRELLELDNYDGLVVFNLALDDENLHCSKQFLNLAKVSDKSLIELKSKEFEMQTKLIVDENLQGTIGFLNFSSQNSKSYDFVKIRIKEAK